jgi:hypothetical protein
VIVYHNPEDTDAQTVYEDWIPDGFVTDGVPVRFVAYPEVPTGSVYWYAEAPWYVHIQLNVEGALEIQRNGVVGLLPYHGIHYLEAFRLLKPRDRCVKCGNFNKYCTCPQEEQDQRVFQLLGGVKAEDMTDERIEQWLQGQ